MALSDCKITGFSKPVSALADTPSMSAAELKAWFDSNSTNEIKTQFNRLVDEMEGQLHVHKNKDVLEAIDKMPVTHEELEQTADVLEAKTNERLGEYATKAEVEEKINVLEAQIGDIGGALDSIIAVQNELTGGGGV